MAVEYHDRWIDCTDSEIQIRGYYFPWGTKHIPYGKIKGLRRFDMTALRGKMRIWGSSNFKYWASLDPGRPSKDVGFILDVGKSVSPFITPADPVSWETVVRSHTSLPTEDGDGSQSPFV